MIRSRLPALAALTVTTQVPRKLSAPPVSGQPVRSARVARWGLNQRARRSCRSLRLQGKRWSLAPPRDSDSAGPITNSAAISRMTMTAISSGLELSGTGSLSTIVAHVHIADELGVGLEELGRVERASLCGLGNEHPPAPIRHAGLALAVIARAARSAAVQVAA